MWFLESEMVLVVVLILRFQESCDGVHQKNLNGVNLLHVTVDHDGGVNKMLFKVKDVNFKCFVPIL